MAIRLYRSNRTEVLADCLGDLVAEPLSDPLAQETVAVQGVGMERWLSMRLSQRFGVWANAAFPFPRALLERVLDAALGEPATALRFDAQDLGWAAAAVLQELPASDPRLSPLSRYLRDAREPDPWLSLGRRLGEIYDRYLLYRPDLILRFEQGHDEGFQGALWRLIVERHGAEHLAARAHRYLERAAAGESLCAHDAAFPERVSVFGVSALPPMFLDVLGALSAQRSVHLFVLAPSRGFMGDLEREARRGAPALLGSLGRLSRDFQQLLEERGEYVEPIPDLFVDPGTDTALHSLQSDLLELRSRHAGSVEATPLPLRPEDRSIRIHDCHSETRELEVLRDQLQQLFDADATLEPRDVVVLAPDVDRYAPAIESVFDVGEDAARLPFHIADRSAGQTSELGSAMLALLELADSRVTLSELSDFLHRPLVHEHFGLAQPDVPLLVGWLERAGARWGLSAEERARHGQPAERFGSLAGALDRLLLGLAMSGEDEPLFGAVTPFDDVEGQSERLDRLTALLSALDENLEALAAPRDTAAWARAVGRAMDELLSDSSRAAGEAGLLREALAQLTASAERGGCHAPLELASFRRELSSQLASGTNGHRFLQGGITFCRHVPMRALPFRVVCLLGMDDEGFPRRVPRASFDLVAERPRRGDRTAADDDRQVFLEAMLSAREHLIITHRGRGIEDDAVRPRAAAVEQLLDVLDAGWVVTSDTGTLALGFERSLPRDALIRVHPLWPFDARYFAEPRSAEWFTYDALAAAARNAMLGPGQAPAPFLARPLPAAPGRSRVVALEELIDFLRNAARFFLRERLGIVLPRDAAVLPDREPPLLSGLDRYRVAEYLRDDARALESQLERLRARAQLPLGDAGRYELSLQRQSVRRLQERAALPGTGRSVRVDVSLDGWRLVGRVDDVYPTGRSELILANLRSKHQLAFWVRQLALCCIEPLPGRLVGRGSGDAVSELACEPITDATAKLETLLRLFAAGQDTPLPLFPEASRSFCASLRRQADPSAALAAAEQAFVAKGVAGLGGEADAPELTQLFGYLPRRTLADSQPAELDATLGFEALARAVFGPMVEALHKP